MRKFVKQTVCVIFCHCATHTHTCVLFIYIYIYIYIYINLEDVTLGTVKDSQHASYPVSFIFCIIGVREVWKCSCSAPICNPCPYLKFFCPGLISLAQFVIVLPRFEICEAAPICNPSCHDLQSLKPAPICNPLIAPFCNS